MHNGMDHWGSKRRWRARSVLYMYLFIAVVGFAPMTCWSGSINNLGLIDPAALKAEAQTWILLDGRPRSAWEAGHIPGAVSFSWEEYTRTDEKGVPHRVLPPPEMAAALGALGIDENSPVAVYGDAEESWGGEGWACWVLSWLGHKGPIRLLDGGIQAWRAAGFPLASGGEGTSRGRAEYRVELRPQLFISTPELVKQRTSVVIIDTRSTWEWFRGHIPLATHISWKDFHTGENRRPLSPDRLKKMLRDHGVDPDKPVVYYCTGGIRSAYAWLAHELAGLPTARNYEGGMEEWKHRYFTYRAVQEEADPRYEPKTEE